MKQKLIEKMLAENNGILKTADVVAAGISKEYFYQYAKKTGLEKAAHGIYLSPDAWPDEMYLLQAQFPKAVFSHETALYLHDLAEKEPMPLTVTVAAKYHNPLLMARGVTIVYVKNEWYNMGISEAVTPGGHTVRVYDMERTICDIIRKRSEMDIAVFTYAVQQYARRKKKDIPTLMEYAGAMHIERQAREIMGVLL
ncbi:type IV toxin-antitoxin system AbiEi family antitoxin domain-containing protein [Intestinibacillus massiliensis]|nr:type IV toxin-antitoxin system AbiEi family antitoxin domain-containing protein [Intestinibacillus massiliensis]